jgi:metal-responsive CopG/Arc/MetJ family transcriptional regulator
LVVKTAISIPNAVYEAAEQLARRIGMSRSELYATAVAEYMVRHRAAGVRERLDAAYDLEDEAARLETVMSIVQSESVPRDDWP